MNSGRVESVSIPGHLTGPEALAPQFVERMLIRVSVQTRTRLPCLIGRQIAGYRAMLVSLYQLTHVSLLIEFIGHAWILESDKGKTVAVRIAQRDLGAVVLVALLTAVKKDAVL
jgi:hypothetical protein